MAVDEKKSQLEKKLALLCETVSNSNKDALTVGIIDLVEGRFLGLYNKTDVFSQAMLEGLAASAVMMLRGPEVCGVEDFISKNTNLEIKHSIKEMFFSTDRVMKFLKVVEGHEILVVVVSSMGSNMALNWLTIRELSQEVDRLLFEP